MFSDTILQPVGPKKKKTVAAPSVKDIKGSENYMLTHQEEDSKGEVETKIYKVIGMPGQTCTELFPIDVLCLLISTGLKINTYGAKI